MKRKKVLSFSFLPYTGNSSKAVYQPLELPGALKEQEEKATFLPQEKISGLVKKLRATKELQHILRQYWVFI